jgi:LPS-assembly protein
MEKISIQADKMEYSSEREVASAQNNVIFVNNHMFALSDSLNYNISSGTITACNGSIYAAPIVIDTSKLHIEQRYQKIENGTLYFGQPDDFALNISARSFEILRFKKVCAKSVTFRAGKVPIFYLPSCTFPIAERPFWLESDHGMQSNLGFFIRNDFYFRANEGVKAGGLLDVYAKRGLLFGPALKVEKREGLAKIFSESKFGFIRDNGSSTLRNRNADQQNIKRDRFFLESKSVAHFGERVDAISHISWWSDSEVTRDFRPSWYEKEQISDSFIEATYRGDDYMLSAFSRLKLNNFYDTVAKIPDLRAEMLPKRLGETRLYHLAYINYTHLKGRDIHKRQHEVDKFDGYYGICAPIFHNNWLNVKPFAGIRLTEYLKQSEYKNHTRSIFQFGFDISALFSGKSDYTNELWHIHGIKHIIQPIVQYRYIPQARISDEHIPIIETRTFDTNLPIIDLADMKNVDDISPQNILRIGLKNMLQTSTDGYLARDLLKFDIYQDIRFKRNIDPTFNSMEKTLSDTYILTGLYPIHWFSLDCYARVDPKNLTLSEITTSTSVHDGDVWKLSLMVHSLQHDTCQCGVKFTTKLNSRIQIGISLHYDTRIKKFTEQRFSIYSILGHSWNTEFMLLIRNGAIRENKHQFAIKLDLVEF